LDTDKINLVDLVSGKQFTGGGQFVTAFTYNDADLPVTMTYPDSEIVTTGYNNNMLPADVSGTSRSKPP